MFHTNIISKLRSISRLDALKILLILLIFIPAIQHRLSYFDQTSKDISAYQDAITSFFNGVNPYIKTIQTYENKEDPGDHGYAYLPGLLYMYGIIYAWCLKFGGAYYILWKIPVLLADLGVGALLAKTLYKKSYWAAVFGVWVWFFNPYNFARSGYTYADPLPILFMFLSLIYLEKDDVAAGAWFALSIVFKTFPVILFPLFLIKSKKKWEFLAAGFLVGVVCCLPFMTSVDNFMTFMKGSIFVHSERIVQGQPFLWYIRYYFDIDFIETVPLKFYTTMATFFGWVLIVAGYYLAKIKDKYILATLSFLNFYFFTPVLNRTYLIWFLPLFILGAFNLSTLAKRRWLYYLIVGVYWVFCYWYLTQWRDGFNIWHPSIY
jgi:hypothetical protein